MKKPSDKSKPAKQRRENEIFVPRKDFKCLSKLSKEKETNVVSAIVNNIEGFCKYILNDKLIKFDVDFPIGLRASRSVRSIKRIDILIRCEDKTYIVETKSPRYKRESRDGIGQLLNYGREFSDPKKELILISSVFDIDTAETIKHYNLPIRFFYIFGTTILEFKETFDA